MLTPAKLDEVKTVARDMNDDGFRALALGVREIEVKAAYSRDDEKDLTMMGFIAFLDPPKDSAADAIQALNANGVDVKILTGDNDIVTRNVCRAPPARPSRRRRGTPRRATGWCRRSHGRAGTG